MGIRGLTGWIRWAAPESMKTPDWTSLKGKKIGIDILGFLYKMKAQRQCPLLYVANMISRLKQYEIIPIMVFDGKPPSEKKNALKKRTDIRVQSELKVQHIEHDMSNMTMSDYQRKILEIELARLRKDTCYLTSEERDVAKQLFYACGVLSLNASGEADNVLAYLSKKGFIDGVISNDMDLLARGVEILFVPDIHALPGDSMGWIQYTLSTILSSVSLAYTQFVEMCVLMGCDYTAGHKYLPYRSAYWAIKYRGEIEKTLESVGIQEYEVYQKSVKMLYGDYDNAVSIMGEKQWEKLAIGAPEIEEEYLSLLRSTLLKSQNESDFKRLLIPQCPLEVSVSSA